MQAVVIVTGAAGNLGRAVLARLAADQYRLVAVDRETTSLEAALAAVPGTDHLPMAGIDLMSAEACDTMVRATLERYGRIDGVVHTVGGFAMAPLAESIPSQFESMFKLNALTTANVFRAAAAPMREAKRGCLIAMGAAPGLKATSGMAAYAASKAAVHRIVEAFADELKLQGVRVNAVLPSIIDTPQNRSSMPDAAHSAWVAPDALASTISFLLGEGGRDVTGALLPVSGRV